MRIHRLVTISAVLLLAFFLASCGGSSSSNKSTSEDNVGDTNNTPSEDNDEEVAVGNLWFTAYWSENLFGITPTELETGILNGSGKQITQPDGWGPEGLAFDADGNLWVSDYYLSTIRVFSPAALATDGQPVPLLTLTGDNIYGPVGIAFDDFGSLWVADYEDGYIARLDNVVGLTGNETVDASVVLTSKSDSAFYGIAFDAFANLWAASYCAGSGCPESSGGQVARYDAKNLNESTVSDGDLIIPLDDGPIAVAFDASGSLYVSFWESGTIYRFDNAANIASGSTPVASAEITVQGFASTRGLAFDATGNLWISGTTTVPELNVGGADVVLAAIENPGSADGSVTPIRSIPVPDADIDGGLMSFWPVPEGLPIQVPWVP